jgi:proteasome lid subunit RPN8/RPN11
MEIELTSGALATLREEATKAFPQECCGLLLGQGARIERVVPAANVHPDPLRHFEIDPAALIAAHRDARGGGLQVLGYYHSHPNGRAEPSATDRAMASGDGRLWAIVAGGAVTLWRDQGVSGFCVVDSRVIA